MMTRKVLCAVLVCGWTGVARAAELPATLVDPYLRIQTALAADKTDGVRQEAAAIAHAATRLGAPGQKLADGAQKLTRAGDLKSARDAFGEVSEALVAYARASGATNPADVRMAFCPMASKHWLQKGDKIQNPYYGSEMLECGEIKK